MPDLGNKHECVSCDARFYDLGRSELICPKCGTDQRAEPDPEQAAAAKAKKKKAKAKKKAAAEEEE